MSSQRKRKAEEPINCARIREDEGYKAELRLRAQTDLFWLAQTVLGYDRISEKYHRAVTNHYVKKDPRKPIEKQDKVKKRLHLDPRGTYKSTLNMCDTVQWIICFPDCAILLLSASSALSKAFVDEVTEKFVLERGARPTAFQELFPEFTIPKSQVLIGKYTAPCRTKSRVEPTLMASSVESSLSGWHQDVLKEDDIHDNRNTETPQSIQKVKKNRHINKKMLMPWGFRDTAGTRYDAFDSYGDDIENARPGEIKVLVRPALLIREGSPYESRFGLRISPERFPEPEECELLFADLLSYEFLRGDYEADYSAFMTQYMNDAFGGKEVVFPSEAVRAAIVPESTIPVRGEAKIAWRFACPSVPGMQYAGATVARQDKSRTYVIDNVRGIFTPTALSNRIVLLAKQYYTHAIQIEQTPGAQHYERHIENAMVENSWQVDIEWLDFESDEGARDLRLRSIEPLLTARRLFFADTLPHLRDLQRQMNAYGMVEDTELLDTTGRIADRMESSIALERSKQASEEALRAMMERDQYERIYGTSHRVMQTAEPEIVEVFEEEEGSPEQYDSGQIAPGLGV